MDPPAEYGFNKPALVCKRFHTIHVVANARKSLEIGGNIFPSLRLGNAELGGEAKCRDSIYNTEIDGLGPSAHVGRHALHWNAEHFRRGHGMNVKAIAERPR